MTEGQSESAIDEAVTLVRGWLDGNLILSKEAVRTLMAEVQRVRTEPAPFMVLPYAEVTDEERRQAEAALDEALKKPYELRVLPPLEDRLDAGSYTISSTLVWELDRSWVRVHHTPCDTQLFGGDGDDPDDLDAAHLLRLITSHRCEAGQ